MHLHEFVQYLLLPFYAEFSWDEVKVDKHRENYIGHSLKAPVGRWQKGKWSLHFFFTSFCVFVLCVSVGGCPIVLVARIFSCSKALKFFSLWLPPWDNT